MSDSLPVRKLDKSTLARQISEEHAHALLVQASQRRAPEQTNAYTGAIVREAAIEAGIASENIDTILLAYFKPQHPTKTPSLEKLLEEKARTMRVELHQFLENTPIGYKAEESVSVPDSNTTILYKTKVETHYGSGKALTIIVEARTPNDEVQKGYTKQNLFSIKGQLWTDSSRARTVANDSQPPEDRPPLSTRVRLALAVLLKGPEGIRPPPRVLIAEDTATQSIPDPIGFTVASYGQYASLQEYLKTQLGAVDTFDVSDRNGLISYAIANCIPALKKDYHQMIQLNSNL